MWGEGLTGNFVPTVPKVFWELSNQMQKHW